MPIPTHVKTARADLAGIGARVTDLHRRLVAELRSAQTLEDPMLSAEGLAQRRREAADRARRTYAQELDALRASVTIDAKVVEGFAGKSRPRLGDDAVALQRAQMKWAQVQTRLDAGMSLHRVIAGADRDSLVAIAEWAPSWLEAQHYRAEPAGLEGALGEASAPDLTGLRNAIDARLAQLGDSDLAWAVEADQEARSAVAGFEPMATHLERMCAGVDSDGLAAATEARMQQHAAAASLPEAGGDAA